MKLYEIREAYEALSGTLSSVTRSLVLAGIGIIWIFVKTSHGIIDIPDELTCPLFLFVISMCCDLMQYLYQSVIWYIFYLCHKSCNMKDEQVEEVSEPEELNIPSWILLVAKVILMIFAYIKIGIYFKMLMSNNSTHTEKAISDIISNDNISAPLNTSIFGMSEELASIMIPTVITIIIFCLSQILSFCYTKRKQYNETKKYRDIVLKWTDMIIPVVKQQADECKKISDAIKSSVELHPERFTFCMSAAEKINCIPADKFMEIFILRSTLKCRFQDKHSNIEKNIYNIISSYNYLSQLQNIVEKNYISYQKQTIDLMNQWNTSYGILTEYISANEHSKYFDIMYNPSTSHIDCYKKIVVPLISKFKTVPGEVSFNIRRILNDLQMIERKRGSLFNEYAAIFNDFSDTIKSLMSTLEISVKFFENETRIKWL